MQPPVRSRFEVLAVDDQRIAAFLAREPEQRFVAHWHPQWSLGAIHEGRCRFACAGSRFDAAAGDVVVMPPAAVHTAGVSVEGFGMTMLYLPAEWVGGLMGWPHGEVPGVMETVRPDAPLADALRRAVARPDGAALPALVHRALDAACSRDTAPASTEPGDPRVRAMCRLLADTPDDGPPDMARLADALAMSREHAHRLFKRAVGLTPGEYRRHARIHDARRRLDAGEPIADVAAACGFTDQAHFGRWFKRVFGVTPAEVRRAGRAVASHAAPP